MRDPSVWRPRAGNDFCAGRLKELLTGGSGAYSWFVGQLWRETDIGNALQEAASALVGHT